MDIECKNLANNPLTLRILTSPKEILKEKIEYYKKRFVLEKKELVKIVLKSPSLLFYPLDGTISRINNFHRHMECDR